jgi:hypothetical protein
MICNCKILETTQLIIPREVEYELWCLHSMKFYASIEWINKKTFPNKTSKIQETVKRECSTFDHPTWEESCCWFRAELKCIPGWPFLPPRKLLQMPYPDPSTWWSVPEDGCFLSPWTRLSQTSSPPVAVWSPSGGIQKPFATISSRTPSPLPCLHRVILVPGNDTKNKPRLSYCLPSVQSACPGSWESHSFSHVSLQNHSC